MLLQNYVSLILPVKQIKTRVPYPSFSTHSSPKIKYAHKWHMEDAYSTNQYQ
jgi:hypothetical protein